MYRSVLHSILQGILFKSSFVCVMSWEKQMFISQLTTHRLRWLSAGPNLAKPVLCVQEVLGKDGPVLLDRFRVNLPFLKGSTKLTLPPHQQAGISTGAQIEAVPVSLFHCLLSLMSTLEKGRSKDAEDFQTVLPGMMACFWDAVCSASKVVDKQRADVSTGAAVDGLEETVDLIVFLDLLGKSKHAVQNISFLNRVCICCGRCCVYRAQAFCNIVLGREPGCFYPAKVHS